MAHITGGGLLDNVPRILADDLTARIDAASWTLPPLFQFLFPSWVLILSGYMLTGRHQRADRAATDAAE